jgi:Ala-tRNA(Pro) deacylase
MTLINNPEQLFAFLDGLGIGHGTVSHPPLFTVEQSRALRGQIPGGHTKNLFLRDKKHALTLVVALEDAEIDLKGLHRTLGAAGRFSFGYHPLVNTMTTSIARDDLVRFLEATGHIPRIERVSGPPPGAG